MTPEELWKEAVHGRVQAWDELYRLFGSRLYHFFLKNMGDIELASDKTQEVFERLFAHRGDFVGGNLKTWIFRIARNLLIDWYRRRFRKEILAEDPPEVADPGPALEESVLNRLEREDLMRRVDQALEGMSEEDRLVLGLVYLGGLSLPELAQVMEIPLGTAKTRTRQARLRLDRWLTKSLSTSKETAAS